MPYFFEVFESIFGIIFVDIVNIENNLHLIGFIEIVLTSRQHLFLTYLLHSKLMKGWNFKWLLSPNYYFVDENLKKKHDRLDEGSQVVEINGQERLG